MCIAVSIHDAGTPSILASMPAMPCIDAAFGIDPIDAVQSIGAQARKRERDATVRRIASASA